MIYRSTGLSFRKLISLAYKYQPISLACSHVNSVDTNQRLVQCIRVSQLHTKQKLKQRKQDDHSKESKLDIGRDNPYDHLSLGQKVMQAGTDLTYITIVVVGFTVIGIIFYAIGSELFSTTGPTKIYNDAFKKCQKTTSVCDALGAPLSAHSDGRNRRIGSHVRHSEYQTPAGEMHTQIQFQIKGQFREATVHAETYKDTNGQSGYEYLVVDVHGHPPRKIVLEKRPPKDKSNEETVQFY